MYVSYDFYMSSGGSIPEDVFAAYEAQAEAYIRYLTWVKGDIFAVEDERVMRAVCAAADVLYSNTGAGARAVKSESNDGYSVTYVAEAQDGQTAEEILRKKVSEAVRIYLLPTGWLSRRVQTGGAHHECADCGHYL